MYFLKCIFLAHGLSFAIDLTGLLYVSGYEIYFIVMLGPVLLCFLYLLFQLKVTSCRCIGYKEKYTTVFSNIKN